MTLEMDRAVPDGFDSLIDARVAGSPVSRLSGRRAFWKHEFEISDDVLDPRPETEVLVAAALERPFDRVIDLGTGSGCIMISLLAERPKTRGVAVDVSDKALDVARTNARTAGVSDRLDLVQSDWWSDVTGTFDLIVSNPPYIAASELKELSREVRLHDPQVALSPGGDGLDGYRMILGGCRKHLAEGGAVLLEIGPTQASDGSILARDAGLSNVTCLPDLDGRDRCLIIEA